MEQAHNGSDDHPVRIAVIGSGPAGVYACEALTGWADATGREIVVDLVEDLPVPYGLLRHGVAPDHPRIKGIARVLRAITDDPRVRFLGNVTFGRDLTVDDARRHYHAIVLSTGAIADRTMGIPGEDLVGSHGAAEFVTWYDGHPDSDPRWSLEAERVAVIGAGNVALDVARMLVRSVDQLEATDIPDHVRSGFAAGRTRVVSVIARRGPAYAKFTPMEVKELSSVGGVRVVVDPADLTMDEEARRLRESDRNVGKVCDQLDSWAELQATSGHLDPDAAEADALARGLRVIRFRFHRAPEEILGRDGRVDALRLARTEPVPGGGVRATGETEDLPVQAVYRAVGYRSVPLDGVPFDERGSTIPHERGQVLHAAGGPPVPGLFTAGWIKRGPTGVIGTNRSCAVETVARLTAQLEAGELALPVEPDPSAVRSLLARRGVTVVDDDGWHAIDAAELAAGAAAGRERTKLPDRATMLAVAAGATVGG